jgi:hypothetical protein
METTQPEPRERAVPDPPHRKTREEFVKGLEADRDRQERR